MVSRKSKMIKKSGKKNNKTRNDKKRRKTRKRTMNAPRADISAAIKWIGNNPTGTRKHFLNYMKKKLKNARK